MEGKAKGVNSKYREMQYQFFDHGLATGYCVHAATRSKLTGLH